jgi:shikimate kinase
VPDNIFLCGLSGSGKSTIAPLLARRRGCEWIDTDANVVEEAGIPIGDIFAREGESGFREREARAVAAACEKRGAVVSLGGGALERDDSFERVCGAGTLVFLDAPDDVLLARLSRSGNEVRPLLAQPGALARLRERRMPRFSRAAITIDTSSLSPDEAARVILSEAREASGVEGPSSG